MFKKVKLFLIFCLINFISLFYFVAHVDTQLANSPWPMFGHDNKHTGRSPYIGYHSNTIKWAYNSSPEFEPIIAADGTIYYSSSFDPSGREAFIALNPDGTIKWKYLLPSGEYVIAQDCAPAIDANSTVYFQSSKYLYAFSSNKTLKWKSNYRGSSPAIGSDGTIYIGFGSALYAINPNDGSIKWQYEIYLRKVGSPAIDDNGNIYFGTSGKASDLDARIYCLSSSGSFKWAKEIERASAPSISSDGTIYIAGTGKYERIEEGYYLYAFNSDGSQKWKYSSLGGYVSSGVAPSIGPDGTIYIGSYDRNLYAINSNGTLKFKYTTGGSIESCPAIDANGTIYFGSRDGNFYALNSGGSLKWKYNTGSVIRSSPAITADGTIYTGDRRLYAFGPPSTTAIIVSGKVSYENKSFNETGVGDSNSVGLKPVRFAKVEIIKDSDKSILGTAETKEDGTYSIQMNSFTNDKIYLKCYANQDNANYKIFVRNPNAGKDSVYFSQSEVKTIDKDKMVIDSNISASSNEGGAFNIFDCLINGAKKVKELSGSSPPPIVVNWQKGLKLETAYSGINGAIDINGEENDPDEYDDAIILHEYGHFIADKYSYDKSPGVSHSVNDINQDIRLSWSEGWATYFSSIVRNNPIYSDIFEDPQTKHYILSSTNIETRSYIFASTNIENLLDTRYDSLASIATGQDNELAVSSILWDIYDTPIRDDDSLSSGAGYIWNIFDNYITNDMDCVLEDFYNGWFAQNGANFHKAEINSIFSSRSVFYSTPSFIRGPIFNKIDGGFIPDGGGRSLNSTLNIRDNLFIRKMNVFVDLPHKHRSDLLVSLISPSGREVILHNHTSPISGQPEDIFAWYQPPYETIPDENLDSFKGGNSQGNWTLIVTDPTNQDLIEDDGRLNRWKIEIMPDNPPRSENLNPAYGTIFYNVPVILTTIYFDPDGWQDIQYAHLLVNNSINTKNCPFVYYDQNTNKLYLRNDADTAWLGGYAPGSVNTIENSYVKLDCVKTIVSGIENTLTISWALILKPVVSGTKYIYLKVVDDAGVENGWTRKGTRTIRNDPIAPSGTIVISEGNEYANSRLVRLTLSAADSGSGMGAGAQMCFSNDGVNYSNPEPYAIFKDWTLSSGDGNKKVYVKYKDTAGNWSTGYSDTITLKIAGITASIIASPMKGRSILKVQFQGSNSVSPKGKIVFYLWDFGDGTASRQANPTHYFSNPDPSKNKYYNIKLTVRDIVGNTAIARAIITVYPN